MNHRTTQGSRLGSSALAGAVASLLALAGPLFSQEHPAVAPLSDAEREALIERYQHEELTDADLALIKDMRDSVVRVLAGYPDEVITAILIVAQEPATLRDHADSEDSDWNDARNFLASNTNVLPLLLEHLRVTAFLGRVARDNPAALWKAIESVRANEPMPELELTYESADFIISAGYEDDWDDTYYYEDGYYYHHDGDDDDDDDHHEEHGDVEDKETYVREGSGDNRVTTEVTEYEDGTKIGETDAHGEIVTRAGEVTIDHGGEFEVNKDHGYAESQQSGRIEGPEGESVEYKRAGQTDFNDEQYDRTAQGSVEGSQGGEATWQTSASGEKTDDGIAGSSTTTIETEGGRSATVDSDVTVEKSGDGYDVDRTSTIETEGGKSVQIDKDATYNPGQGASVSRSLGGNAAGQSSAYSAPSNINWDAAYKNASSMNKSIQKSSYAHPSNGSQHRSVSSMSSSQYQSSMNRSRPETHQQFERNEQSLQRTAQTRPQQSQQRPQAQTQQRQQRSQQAPARSGSAPRRR